MATETEITAAQWAMGIEKDFTKVKVASTFDFYDMAVIDSPCVAGF